MRWRGNPRSGNTFGIGVAVGAFSMSPEALVFALVWSDSARSLLDLAIGFAVAGMLSSGYQLLTLQPASFRLLHDGERNRALAAVPFLLFAAPFIIVRNTIRGARFDGRNFGFAALAALVAGFWSLMSGSVVVMALEAVGRLVA
jgi:hypothetical protein